MGGDQELRRGQQSMQGDVLIPDMGAGKYWYVDPRAGLAQQPAQALPQQSTYDPMADERSNQAQLKMWGGQSDLVNRPTSSQSYDPMDAVRRRAAYKEQVDQMYHSMGREDVDKTVTMNIGGKEWEVPAVFDEMSDEDRNIVHYLPHTQWPKSLMQKIETNAIDELHQGNDPYGNSLPPGVLQRMGF